MKKVLSALVGILLAIGTASAQDDGAKLAKAAGKALAAYNQSPSDSGSKLTEAKAKIDQAFGLLGDQAPVSAYLTRGEVYSTLLLRDMTMQQFKPESALTGDNDALVSFNAYKMAYEKPEVKKFEKTEAINGVESMQQYLINLGVLKYNAKEYEKAFLSFRAALEAHEILKDNKKKSILDETKEYEDQLFFTGLMASLANRCADAVKFYEPLYRKGTDNVAVYEGLYTCKTELKEEAAARAVLAEGRKKFPEDASLLFAEINYYISKGRLDELTGSLEEAIQKEPDNVTLYNKLGEIYNNLFANLLEDSTKTTEQKTPQLKEYAAKAKTNFKIAVEKEPKNADANYSFGALLYNETNILAKEMNATDFASSAGQKRYKELKVQMLAGVDDALKYFQIAESLEPNDASILGALLQAYGRKEDEELYMEFKKRLDVVKAGGKNASSYFKN
jgi:hypothetical protein